MHVIRYLLISLLIGVMGFPFGANAKAENSQPILAEIEFSKSSIYPGEIVMATLVLTCEDTELGYIRNVPNIASNKGEFTTQVAINGSGAPKVYKQDNKLMRSYPIAQYAVALNALGKIEIKADDVIVGINHPEIHNDPFWGPIRSYRTEENVVKFKSTNIEVKKLPENKEKLPYSGAIGNFEIKMVVPNQQFVVNETGTIYIVIEGAGHLPEEILPEYTEAFGDNVKLKSISGSARTFYDGEKLISNRTWECEIVPKSVGEQEVGAVSFGFFNVDNGKFEVCVSEPIKINVKSSTVKREVLDI